MKNDKLPHDLFLLLLNLSQLHNRDTILSLFLDAFNSEDLGLNFTMFSGEAEKTDWIEPIATIGSNYGQLLIKQTAEISTETRMLIRNAVRMLAIILEKNEQDKFLTSERQTLQDSFDIQSQKLLDSQQNFRLLTQKVPVAICICNGNTIEFLNDRFIKTFGYTLQDIPNIDEWWWQAYPDVDYRREVIEMWTNIINDVDEENADIKSHQYRVTAKDGTVRTIEVFGTLIGTKSMILFNDVTEKNEVEEALRESEFILKHQNEEYLALNEELMETNLQIQQINQELTLSKEKAEDADRLKSAFLANMSHEIRTPMNAIKGFAGLLENPNLDEPKRQRFVKIINQRTDDLLQIINDILDISKIESGQMKITEEDGDLDEMFVEIHEFFTSRNDFVEKKEIQFNISQDLNNYFISTDFTRLRQILLNLVGNAFKFTVQGQIELGAKKQDDNNILFYVRDTGIGIEQNKQQLIFERFRQADDSFLAKQHGGVGLGLSISKGLLDLMGGKIWVESEFGKGTIFYFTIPYRPVKELLTEEFSDEQTIDWQNKVILLVEDDLYNADYIIQTVSDTKVICKHAANGKTALAIFNTCPRIDVVLMDIRLPDINGFDLTQQMKKINPTIPIIAQTAYASNEEKAKCFEAGCDDFISKPIMREILLKTIQQYF